MSLKFTTLVVDENVPKPVVDHLKSMGFKEVYWINDHRSGQSDPEVWRLAAAKGAVLLTGDLGFAPQLEQQELLQGPQVVTFSTDGIRSDELKDHCIMQFLLEWLFKNKHHTSGEWTDMRVIGKARTRRKIHQETQADRLKKGKL